MQPDPASAKRALRARVRTDRRRRAADPAALRADDEALGARCLAIVREHGATVVAAYLSAADEPGTRAFLRDAVRAGVRVLLPVSLEGGELDWVDADGAGERLHPLGVPEPVGVRLGAGALADAELVLAPAAAVDARGGRLGWGLGYYDRALAALPARPPVYVVVHDDEVVDEVPVEAQDAPVDGAVTPTRTLRFRP